MKRLLILSLVFCCYHSMAQLQGQALIDSLEAVAPGMKDDSNKVKTYSRISQIYYGLNPMKTFEPAEKALQIAEKINWKRGIANIHNNLGLFISDTGNYTLGTEHYKKSYTLNKELDAKPHQINNLNNIGRNYQSQSDFTTAATYFFQALAIAQAIKSDEHIALVGTNLGSCFYRQKNYPKATEYAEMTLKHANLANNSRHAINALMQLGTIRLNLKDTASANAYLEKALKVCEETNNQSDMVKVLINMAVTVYPDYRRAIPLMLRADTIVREIAPGTETDMVNSYNLAEAYLQVAKQSSAAEKALYYRNAATWLDKAKEVAGDRPEQMVNILLLQGDMEEEAGNYKTALAHFKRATAISDSLFSQEKKNEIAGLEGKHNIAIKDNEIAINKLMLTNQRKAQWGLIAGLVLLGIIGGLLYWQSRARKKTNTTLMVLNNQLDEANKVKARFFGILSHDLRSPIVNLVHFLQLQKDSPDLLNEQQQQNHRQNISDSAENLLNTMETMLLWSKEQMESFKPNMQEVAVDSLFEYIRNFFGQHENINLQFIAPPGLKVLTDDNYLRTIMQNLTSNAIRALQKTDNASIVWEAKEEARGVALSITDNGPGIAAAKADALFDGRTANNEKTGFGLHLVRDLAKAIQYKIAVQSEPGKGTTFILSH